MLRWTIAKLNGILVAILHLSFDLDELVEVESSLNEWRKVLSNYLVLWLLYDKLGGVDLGQNGPHPCIESKHCLDALLSKSGVHGAHATERVPANNEFIKVKSGIWVEPEGFLYHLILVVYVINQRDSLGEPDLQPRYPDIPVIRIHHTGPILIIATLQPGIVARAIVVINTEYNVAMRCIVSTAARLERPTTS